jgi:flavin reductase (DIM6/NTAB) family NADH-FMN oxidoreductase RutF
MQQPDKIEIPCDKHEWRPSPVLGQIVLVTTVDTEGRPDVAPKSWISMVAFGPPPIIMFGCTLEHVTAQNALASGEFVVNVPGSDLASTCYDVAHDRPADRSTRFNRHRLTPVPSSVVAPPRIAECGAHLECRVDGHREWGSETAIFGRVEVVAVSEHILEGEAGRRYANLDPIFFLEDHRYCTLGVVTRFDG